MSAVYAAILIASAGLLALHLLAHDILPWAQALLAIQIVYKLLSAPLAGLRNPVVLSNLAIAAVHAATLFLTAS